MTIESDNRDLSSLDRTDTEATLRAQERHVHGVLHNLADGVATIDEGGVIESFNRAAEKMFGFTAREVIGKNITILMPGLDRRQHDGYLTAYLDTGLGKILGVGLREVRARHKDGTIFAMELSVGETDLGDRRVFIGAMRDITVRVQSTDALRNSQKELAEAQRIAHIGSWRWNIDADEVTWSDEHWAILGLEPGEVSRIDLDFFDSFVHPDDLEGLRSARQRALETGSSFSADYRIVRRDGEVRYVRSGSGDTDPGRNIVGTIQDVTEVRRTEKALRSSNSMFDQTFKTSPNMIAGLRRP